MMGPGVQVEIEDRGTRKAYSSIVEAREAVLSCPVGLVVKADGLAAGKGVYVCSNLRQALDAIDQIMVRPSTATRGPTPAAWRPSPPPRWSRLS